MARRLSDYEIDHEDVLDALKLDREELAVLTDRWFALAKDAAWSALGLGLALVIGVAITASGAWLGLLIAGALGFGGAYAEDKDQNVLALVLFLGALGGLGRAVQCTVLEGIESFAAALAVALLAGILVLFVLRCRRVVVRWRCGASTVRRLLRDVARFHDAIELATLQTELAQHGAAPAPSASLHKALAATRASLLRALAVHGALRAHVDVLRRASVDPAGRFLPGSADRVAREAQQCAEVLARELEALASARLELDADARAQA
jgi:hypothetical protein